MLLPLGGFNAALLSGHERLFSWKGSAGRRGSSSVQINGGGGCCRFLTAASWAVLTYGGAHPPSRSGSVDAALLHVECSDGVRHDINGAQRSDFLYDQRKSRYSWEDIREEACESPHSSRFQIPRGCRELSSWACALPWCSRQMIVTRDKRRGMLKLECLRNGLSR